ncbi:MAG: VPLPA-CTERM sorting domain-containing protein [Pseudomonadota bacterium]
MAFDDESTEGEKLNDVLARTNMLPGGAFEQSDVKSAFVVPRPASDGDLPVVSYNAEESLSAFDSMELAGTWEVTFFDSVVPNEGDVLGGFQLYGTVDVAAVPLPASLPLLLAGFGGMAALLRRKKAA